MPNDSGCTFLVRWRLRPSARPDTVRRCLRSGWWGWAEWACLSAQTWSGPGTRVLAGDLGPEAGRQAAGCGARWVPEIGRLAAGADVLITVRPGPSEVRELMLSAGGAAAALRPARRGST
jgi:hypothetical protein